jgi:hypothetical protein
MSFCGYPHKYSPTKQIRRKRTTLVVQDFLPAMRPFLLQTCLCYDICSGFVFVGAEKCYSPMYISLRFSEFHSGSIPATSVGCRAATILLANPLTSPLWHFSGSNGLCGKDSACFVLPSLIFVENFGLIPCVSVWGFVCFYKLV